tara:strand:- start:25075 stop:25245 length:171 start_codon:yes stop_codon:yes gene_type:complete
MNARIQHKQDKRKIDKLEKRILYLIGCNEELELLISKYEKKEKFEQLLDKQWADAF